MVDAKGTSKIAISTSSKQSDLSGRANAQDRLSTYPDDSGERLNSSMNLPAMETQRA